MCGMAYPPPPKKKNENELVVDALSVLSGVVASSVSDSYTMTPHPMAAALRAGPRDAGKVASRYAPLPSTSFALVVFPRVRRERTEMHRTELTPL